LIHWHSSSTLGFFIFSPGVRTRPMPRVIQNTAVSKWSIKCLSITYLDLVVFKSSLQVWLQGSLHE
jgi:hypothetical protein